MAVKQAVPTPERRDTERHAIDVTMPVQVLEALSGRALQCRIYDVSTEGLCVVTAQPLVVGTELVFVTLKEQVPLIVAWCHPDGAREHRCGLRLTASHSDLRSVFPGVLTTAGRS